MMKTNFCTRKRWVSTDPWRGYEQPLYAVAGANDTGMWNDSPCRSDVCKAELSEIQKQLRKANIRSRRMVCRSSNVFCVHQYLICSPEDVETGRKVVRKFLEETHTDFSYLVN